MAELIAGYKSWRISYIGDKTRFVLRSPYFSSIPWQTEMQAECFCPGDAHEHLSRGECSCGIYSYKGIEQFDKNSLEDIVFYGRILGKILHYGVVNEYKEGYRSEYAIIDTLFKVQAFCAYCYRLYGKHTPAEFFPVSNTLEIRYYLCLEHYRELRPAMRETKFYPIEVMWHGLAVSYPDVKIVELPAEVLLKRVWSS